MKAGRLRGLVACVASSLMAMSCSTPKCSSHTHTPASAADARQASALGEARTARAWERLKQALPGTWKAQTGEGKAISETFRIVSNDTTLVETFVTPNGHETISVYHRDRGDLLLTHYCNQGNQPRLRATSVDDDAIVFRYADATNLQPEQDVLVEKALRLTPAGLEQIEIYRQPNGALDKTVLHFAR